jgi:tetratricopeptide (TPR) repeat protein
MYRQILSKFITITIYITLLQFVYSQTPPTPSAAQLRVLGQTAISKQEYNLANKYFTQLLNVEPSQLNYFQRSNVYLKQHLYEQAISDLTSAIQLDSQFIKGILLRSKIYKIIGQCELAMKDIQNILSLKSNHKDALNELPKITNCIHFISNAQSLFQQQQYDSAKHYLSQALDIAYDSEILLILRIQIHMVQHDYQSILVDTRKILQMNKNNLDAYYYRGSAYYYLGEHENALNHFKEGLRLDPEHKLIKTDIKKLKQLLKYIATGDSLLNTQTQEAIENFQHAINHDVKHTQLQPILYVKLCSAYVILKKGEQAIEACTRAIQMDENNLEAVNKIYV